MMKITRAESSFATIALYRLGGHDKPGTFRGNEKMQNAPSHSAAARTVRVHLIAIALLALIGLRVPSARAAALSVYGGLPSIEDVAISPDGSRLAYVRTQGDLRIVVIANVADHKMIRWVKAGEEKLRDVEWADDDNVLITTSATTSVYGFKSEWYLLRVYNVPKNEIHSLPGDTPGVLSGSVKIVTGPVMVRHIDDHTVLFMPGQDQNQDDELYRCDITTGLTRIFRTDEAGNESWLVDGQGRLAGQQDYDEQTQRWSISLFHGDTASEAASGHAALDAPNILGFGPTTDTLLVESIENRHRVWQLLSLKDGKFQPMPRGSLFDEPLGDPLTGRMIGGINTVDLPQYVFFDPTWAARWQAVVKAFDPDGVELVSSSSDFSKIVALVEGPTYGYRYILIDLQKNNAAPIGNAYDGIDKLHEVRPITYAAGDGLPVHAYLTLPDRPAHGLPLVMLPHGGPSARDTAEFDWWAQALADQGYAVLQPNYRGSNVTVALKEAGYGQWGRKMQTDLSDGVSYLAKQGIIDPAKVCIAGASYGGYAALAGITLQPTVYRCAVSVAGISDLARFMEWEGRGGTDARDIDRYWDRYWGVSGSSDPALDAISPIKHVAAVTGPVLLIHGRDDTVVPYEQSQVMFDALHRQGKDVQLITLNHEDHQLSHGDTRLQMLQATVDFLRAHDPPN